MGLFSKGKDSFKIKNNACVVKFEASGELTKERVREIFGLEKVKSCADVAVYVGGLVTAIRDNAFYGCAGVTEVYISNGASTIGESAFGGCGALKRITIPESITSIGVTAFAGCASLLELSVDEKNKIYCSIDGNLYAQRGKIMVKYALGKADKDFAIPDGVYWVGPRAFMVCPHIESIRVPASVKKIDASAFGQCPHLKSIEVDEANGFYKSIDGNLYTKDEEVLIQYAIGKTETSFRVPPMVTKIEDASFCRAMSLTSVTLPDDLECIGDFAFTRCRSLKEIVIPAAVTSVGYSAFSYCDNVSIYCVAPSPQEGWSSFNTSNRPVAWGYASPDAPQRKKMVNENVDDEYEINGDTCTVSFKQCGKLTAKRVEKIMGSAGVKACKSVYVELDDEVTGIEAFAFNGCKNLVSISIHKDISQIGEGAFKGCKGLADIKIDEKNQYYKMVKGMLYTSDTELVLHCLISGEGKSVDLLPGTKRVGDSAFCGCSRVKEVTIPAGVKEIGNRAFSTAGIEGTLKIPEGVEKIGAEAFCGDFIAKVEIPASVKEIGEHVFLWCYSLSEISVAQGNTVYKSIDGNLYTGDGAVLIQYAADKQEKTFYVPKGVVKIADEAFTSCDKLEKVIIPEGVSSIGKYAFRYCSALTMVTVPKSVTEMGACAVINCPKVALYCAADSKPNTWNANWRFDKFPIEWGWKG